MRYRGVLVVILVLLMLFVVYPPRGGAEPLSLEKRIDRNYYFLPNGTLAESRVYVTLVIEGWGTYNIVDRVAFVKPSSFEFYGDEPDGVVEVNDIVVITWRGVEVEGKKTLRYSFDTDYSLIKLRAKVLVNGSEASLDCSEGVCKINADVGSEVKYVLTLENTLRHEGVSPPIAVLVSLLLDPEYLALEYCEPECTTSSLGNLLALSWTLLLENTTEIRLEFTVKSLNEWMEAPIPSVKISVSLDPSRSLEKIRELEAELQRSLDALTVVEKLSNTSREGFLNVISMMENLSLSLGAYGERLLSASELAIETAQALRNSSILAETASRELKDMASRMDVVRKLKSRVDEYGEALQKIASDLQSFNIEDDELEDVLSEVNETVLLDVKSNINRAQKEISYIKKILNSIEETREEAYEGAETLELLSSWLAKGAEGMENLSDALSSAHGKLCALREDLANYTSILKDKVGEIDKEMVNLRAIKDEVSRRLEDTKLKEEALTYLHEVYLLQRPVCERDGERVIGTITSDLVIVTLPSIRITIPVKAPREGQSSSIGSERRISVAMILLLIISCLAPVTVVLRLRRYDYNEFSDRMEKALRDLEKIAAKMVTSEKN